MNRGPLKISVQSLLKTLQSSQCLSERAELKGEIQGANNVIS